MLSRRGVATNKRYIEIMAGSLDTVEEPVKPCDLQIARGGQRNEEIHSHSAHRADITHIYCHGFVADRVGRMKVAKEVSVFSNKIRAKNSGIAWRKIEDRGVIADRNCDIAGKSLANLADQPAYRR